MRVLVAADGSAPALRACELVARLVPPGAGEVRLLVVLSYELYPYGLGDAGPLSDAEEREAAMRRAIAAATGEGRRVLEGAGHRVTVVHRFGRPAEEIAKEVEETLPDLLVLGRRGLRAPARWLSSVSEGVLHRTWVPTLLVP